MICKKCFKEIEDDSVFCRFCGRKQVYQQRKRFRGNGQGSVYKYGDKYRAVVTLQTYTDENGKRHRKTAMRTCSTKKEAAAAIGLLLSAPQKKERTSITFKALYDKWLPTHEASKSTINCYKSAMKYFEPIWFNKMEDIDIDDLQDCVDSCGHGKRTMENMRAVAGLVYKYGIPRQAVPENLNLAQFLRVTGDAPAHRESFTDVQIEAIRKQIGKVENAEQVYCLIYLGLRPSEFLALTKDSYDKSRQIIVGGAKTEAGKGRTVTVSPKIQKYMMQLSKTKGIPLVASEDGKEYSLKAWTDSVFYPTLEAAGIDNPIIETGEGTQRHKYTPHSCRHTFSTLMKRVSGADKDKLELIGHTSTEMLRYYQDVSLDDLRKITDAI